MNPIARRTNIFSENLPTEVVLYNKQTQEVHCLNKTVAIVWENADGTRSVDQLAHLLEQQLGVSLGRDLALAALAELSASGLLENVQEESKEETVSRRNIARRLAVAGVSSAILPIAYLVAPPFKAAACEGTALKDQASAYADLATKGLLGTGSTQTNPIFKSGLTGSSVNAEHDYIAGNDYLNGANNGNYDPTKAVNYGTAETDYSNATNALGYGGLPTQ